MANEFISKEELAEKEEQVKKNRQPKEKSSKRAKASAFIQILNGEFLVKDFVLNNLTFIFFLIFLMLMLVAKGYYGKQLSNDIDASQKALDASVAEYVEAKAKLEEETRRSELVEQLGPKGLKETVNPAKVIRIKKEKE